MHFGTDVCRGMSFNYL